MVLKEERERINKILSEALPILCTTYMNSPGDVSIDALIGITINTGEVILVQVNEKVSKASTLEPNMYSLAEENDKIYQAGIKKSPPKRRHVSDFAADPGKLLLFCRD